MAAPRSTKKSTVRRATTDKGGDKDAFGNFLDSLTKSVLNNSALHSLAQAGAAFGEAKAAARLQARAAVFAALATKPYKNGEKPRAELVAEAIAVVAELEKGAQPATVDVQGMTDAAANEMIRAYTSACDLVEEAEVGRGTPAGDRSHSAALEARRIARAALHTALMGNRKNHDAFGFLGSATSRSRPTL